MDRIALIGAGFIGQAWAIVFARAGRTVTMHDPDRGVLDGARDQIRARLEDLRAFGLIDDPDGILRRVAISTALGDALAGAAYVQESGPENVEVKQAIFAELDRHAAADAILASSTSGIPASRFTEALAGRARCLVAHPINPPFLVPLVELCPAPWTDPQVLEGAYELMRAVGQSPIRMRREVDGFIANRMQGALIGSALKIVGEGYASAADVDTAIRDGIGLRWSFMGPFETIDLNAPGGIADYLRRYGPLYAEIERQQATPGPWEGPVVEQVEAERRTILPADQLPSRSGWRDRRLMGLVAHKRRAAKAIGG